MIDYYKNIPEDLKKEKRWCLYRIVNRNGKNTKIPIEPSGKYAKVSDKATWNTYERCLNSLDKADGLGFFLGDGYVGIDLDDVADDVYAYFTDNKDSVASDFLKNIDTYAEVSPSGRGIHFIGKGKLEGTRRRSGNIEIYDKDRFFTVTGKILNDKYRKKITNIETEINQLKANYLPEFEKSEIDKSEVGDYKDREVLELFLNTDIGDTSEVKNEIFNGKWEKKFSSQSEADFYLARNLLFFNGGNIEQAYRLMNQSKLAREKWDEQRGSTDYLEYVLVRAKDGLTSYFQRGEKEEITTVNRKYTIDEVKQLINETINSFNDIENFNNYLKVSASNNNTFYTDRLMLLRFRKDSEETKSFEGWIETGRVVNKGEEGIPVLRNGQVKYIYDKSQTVVVNAELEKEAEKSNKTVVEKLKELNTFVNTESIENTIENLGISYARRVYSRVRDNAPKTFESLDENVLGDFIKNTFTTIVKLKSGINAPDIKDEKGVLKVFLKNENDLKELLYSFWGCENALFNNLENRIEEIQRKMINDIDIDSTNGYNINRDIINKEGSEENVSQSEVRSEEQRILNRRNNLLSGGKDERDGRDRLLAGRDGAGKSGIGDVGSGDRQGFDETSFDGDNRGTDDERHRLDDRRSVQSGSRVGNDENQRDGGNERQIRGTDPRSGSRDRTDRREDELLSGRERGIQETLRDLRQIDGQESGVGSEIRERDVRPGQQISEERMVGSGRERELGRKSLQPEEQPLEQSDLGRSRGHDEPISEVKSGMDKGQSSDILQTDILDRSFENIPGQLPKEDRGLQENREAENDRGMGERIRETAAERDDEKPGELTQGDDLLQRDPVTIDDKKEADEASFSLGKNKDNDYWVIEFNETSELVTKDYAGIKLTKELIDEIRELDVKQQLYNKIVATDENGTVDYDKYQGYSKFYFDHIVDGDVVEHTRVDIGDGETANRAIFAELYSYLDENFYELPKLDLERIENDVRKEPTYILGFFHLGNGITVYDMNAIDNDLRNYPKVGFINDDRTINIYESLNNYAEDTKDEILKDIKFKALTDDSNISTTQGLKVFKTKPLFDIYKITDDLNEKRTSDLVFETKALVALLTTEEFNSYVLNNKAMENADTLEQYNQLNNYVKNIFISGKTEKIAVKVGNEFILENKSIFNNIDLTEDDRKVEVDGKKYNLFKGSNFEESQKIDKLLDSGNYEIYKLSEEEKQIDTTQKVATENLPTDKESLSFARDYDLNTHIYSKYLTPSEKLDKNIKAIKMLKRLENENRNPKEYEQAYLADYLGWGGLSDVFDERKGGQWKEARDYLKKNLTFEEYERARESTLTAFYTPNNVISAIYKKLEDMGFNGGEVLDPSTGTGRFIGNLPKDLKDKTNFTAIELDSITGKIAKYLYPNQNVNISGYEDFSVSDNSFDVAITNVPFGNFKVFDNEYNKYNLFIHDYFFKKSIDKVRDGGIIAFITSSGTMDKKSNDIRKMIDEKADFLGAVRLPNDLFKNEAGTSVMSDIIFLQKNENKEVENEKSEWLTAVPNLYGAIVNNYFLSNPEQVVGTLKTVNGRFGKELITTLDDDSDFDELLEKALSNISGKITERKEIEKTESEIESILAPENEKRYSYFLKDDEIYFKEDLYAYKVSANKTDTARLKKYIPLRNTLLKLVEKQNEDIPDDDQELIYLRSELLERYNDFNDTLGRINESKNFRILSDDGYSGLVSSLEIMDDDNEFEKLSSIFEKRNIRPERKITQVDNSKDALILSMQFKGKVDFVYMEQLSNKTKPELINDLSDEIFLDFNTVDFSKDNIYEEAKYNSDPNRYVFETRAEFLSGDIRRKLARINAYKNKLTILMDNNSDDIDKEKLNAEMNIAKYQANLLENVMPKDLSAGDINVRLGSTWIETYDYEDFMKETFSAPYGATVEYSPSNSKFRLDRGTLNTYSDIVNVAFGTSRMDAYKIMENTMNMKSVEVKDVFTEDGKRYEVLNQAETDKALMMQAKIEEAFKEWIFKDSTRRQRLVAKYNELFNSYRQREYDGENLVLSGINPDIKLREHQKSAIERDLYSTTSTLLAHAVGAGKTFEMACIAMESKRLGLSNKSLIVVPKNIVQQFAREFYSIYPTANLLVASEKDFNPQKRRQFIGRIATGDYDAIIIANSQFQKIPVSWERQKLTMERELAAYRALEDSGFKGDFSVKQAENARKRLEKRYKEFLNTPKDDMLCFEELGVDKLIIDEAHNYKNLAFQTTLSNIAGINTNGSQRSLDMLMKCEYIRELNNGKGVVFATGTPVSNSMAELYTMSRYLDPQGLEDKGIFNFDAWASNFADITVGYELEATGTKFRKRTRFSKFNNLPELMNIVKSFADIRTSDMLNLPVPEVEVKLETIEPSEIQKDYIKSLGDRADKIKSGSVDPSVDNMLVVTNDGKNLALDQRLVDPLLPDDPNSKVNACVGNVFRIYKDTEDKKLTQLIFCDTATPGGSSNICVYDDIKEKLIKMGAKESEIAFVHDAKNDKAKAELFSKVNKGEIRVLIGSTSKMGTGTNVQKKLIATHDLDVPWRPSDLEQRAGRIIRQGNENKKVEIYRYVTKGTLDSFLWQTLENKQRYISQVMTSRTPERSMEDCDEVTLDYATIKGIANCNPLIEEKFRLETEVAKLKTYEAAYRNNLYQYEDNLKIQYPKKEAIIKKKISDLTADIERRIDCNNEDKKFIGMQFENSFTDKKDIASEALMKNISKIEHSIKADPVKLCGYRGFEIYGKYEPLIGGEFKSCHQFIVKGSGSYIGELSDSGYGNIVRIDNVINNLTFKLEEAKSALIDLNNQKNNALEEINKPFAYKNELEYKVNRLNEVNKEIEIKTEGEPQQDLEKEEKNKSLVNDMETFREKAKAYNLERVSPGMKEKANEL